LTFCIESLNNEKQGGKIMDVRTYCNSVQAELAGWKAKVYDIMRELDKTPADEKQQLKPQINNLHTIIDELTDNLEFLARECPAEYGSQKTEIDDKMSELKNKWEDAWDALSVLFGG
jgi:predicted nuclease with TOPRIM domain